MVVRQHLKRVVRIADNRIVIDDVHSGYDHCDQYCQRCHSKNNKSAFKFADHDTLVSFFDYFEGISGVTQSFYPDIRFKSREFLAQV